jgi:Flp pilus assembly pilin Flp
VNPFISYTLARLGLLAVTLGIGYLFGLRGPVLIIVGFLVSGLISLVLLNSQRSQLGGRISGYFSGINQKLDANTRKEDIDE